MEGATSSMVMVPAIWCGDLLIEGGALDRCCDVKFPSWVDWYMIASDKVYQVVKEIILQYPLYVLLKST